MPQRRKELKVKMKKAKKILWVLAVCVLTLACMAFSAAAESEGYYTYTVSDGKATITDVDEAISGDVIMPDMLGGYPVTTIGYSAFYNCTGLENIKILDSFTTIGNSCFGGCIFKKVTASLDSKTENRREGEVVADYVPFTPKLFP